MANPPQFRLLVVRLGAMGDILHALPAITALRRARPAWQIDWVVEPAWQPLLRAPGEPADGSDPQAAAERSAAQPVVDRVYPAATKQWVRAPFRSRALGGMAALRRQLRGVGYDAVLDLQGALRSALVGGLAGCARRIGESAPREWIARWLYTQRIATKGRHVIEQDLELASAVAGEPLPYEPPLLPVDPAAEAWCGDLLNGTRGEPVALLHPGAGWGAKCWPAERYGALAEALAERGLRVLVNAAPGEEPLAEAVRQASRGAAEPVRSSLSQLIAVTRRAALVIGGDTGPLHLACALERPVVGIYGPTDPARNGPFGTRFKVLRSPASRRDHSRRDAPEAGLLTITPKDVLGAAESLMAKVAAS